MNRILSLDTSTTATGYALHEGEKYIQSGVIKEEGKMNERVYYMVKDIYGKIKLFCPDVIVVQDTVVPRNAMTQRMLSMLLGAVYGYCTEHGIKFVSLRPSVWRKYSASGQKPRHRQELKEWSKQIFRKTFDREPIDDNEADAYLLGRAYIKMVKEQRL